MAALSDFQALLDFRPTARPALPTIAQRPVTAQSAKTAHRRAHSDLAALKMRLAYLVLDEKANYDESQPRWPKGSGDISGRWSGGPTSGTLTERVQVAARGGGHHYIPRAVFDSAEFDLPMRPGRFWTASSLDHSGQE